MYTPWERASVKENTPVSAVKLEDAALSAVKMDAPTVARTECLVADATVEEVLSLARNWQDRENGMVLVHFVRTTLLNLQGEKDTPRSTLERARRAARARRAVATIKRPNH